MKTKEDLAKVFEETENCIEVGGYKNFNGEWIELEDQEKMIDGSKMYYSLSAIKNKKFFKEFTETKIYVQNIDTFQKAREMGSNCAVLNMASERHPGGGVKNGSRAQEEELCRRSNLALSLYKFSNEEWATFKDLLEEPGKFHYPITSYGGIYSPRVKVFKSYLSYNHLDEPFECSVISVPALRKPKLINGKLSEEDAIKTKGKIRAILRIALLHYHTKLVLGALGCGSFGNPPQHVAQLFKEVLEEKEFKGHFEEICFAILEDGNSKEHGGNLKPFKDVFGV